MLLSYFCQSVGVWLDTVTMKARLLGLMVFSVMAFQTATYMWYEKNLSNVVDFQLGGNLGDSNHTHIDILVSVIVDVQYVGGVAKGHNWTCSQCPGSDGTQYCTIIALPLPVNVSV